MPEIVDRLDGHSGCTVLLCRTADGLFVRKISPSPAYNGRLRSQISKQRRLQATIRTPRVMSAGEIDGLAFFDMEYIRARGLHALVAVNGQAALAALADRILAAVEKLASRRSGTLASMGFERKIESVAGAVAANTHYARHRRAIDGAIARLRTIRWDGIPRTECHGDLTLENILVDEEGSLALIDVLDGDLESAWLDIAKLLHDVESGWSFRRRLWSGRRSRADRHAAVSCGYIRELLAAGAAAMFPDVVPRLADLQALQALRVLPYAKERGTFARLVASVEAYERKARP